MVAQAFVPLPHVRPAAGVKSWSDLRLAAPLFLRVPLTMHVIRHGETVTNAQRLVTGSVDAELSTHGVTQAKEVGTRLDQRYPLAFVSTLRRSRATLEYAVRSNAVHVAILKSDPRLNERSLGVLEMQPERFIPAYAEGDLEFAPPGGESYELVARRVLGFLLDLAELAEDARVNKVLICGHMGPLRILCGIAEAARDSRTVLARHFRNTELLKLEVDRVAIPPFLSRYANG